MTPLLWALIGAAITLALGGAAYGAYWAVLHIRIRKAVPVAAVQKAALDGGQIEAVYARSVDRIDIGSIVDTGLTTAIKRYRFSLEFWWTDTDGTKRHYPATEYTWPNDLSDVPLRIVKGWATDLITQAVRWRLGVDAPPEP